MLNQISIKTRLLLFTGFMCLFILAVDYISLRAINKTVEGMVEVYKGSVDSIEILKRIENVMTQSNNIPLQKLRDGTITWEQAKTFIIDGMRATNEAIGLYSQTHSDNPTYVQKVTELQSLLKPHDEVFNNLLGVLRNEDMLQLNQFIANDLYAKTEPIIKKVNEMIKLHVLETRNDYQTAIKNAQNTENLMLYVPIGIFLLVLTFALLIIRSILIPLDKAVNMIDRVALGENSMEINLTGNDESTRMMRAMKNMNDSSAIMTNILGAISNGDLTVPVPIRSQKDTLGQGLNSMVVHLTQIISEIQSEVHALTSSTEEIVTSVNQVSTNTAETAAAVTETTTTVEELKQTAQISADMAKDVFANAEETLKIVRNSEQTLQTTIEEMNQIEDKMRIISESIVSLSEHCLAIGEIINSVNNLAEQSNLLAVNAAIEAAKAGEQGKSFGVVAQEIRTLAEQSKEATVQVRAILNDIQNSTSAAVLATEQGSKAVIKGVAQSSEISEAIHILSNGISRVAHAANQISISSQQQLIGVEQVTVAMANISEASNQHVDNMHQIEVAVNSLKNVANSLKKLVNQYKILPKANVDGFFESGGYPLNETPGIHALPVSFAPTIK